MPELPDVEIFRKRLEKAARRRRIHDVRVLDTRLVANVSPGRFARRLIGRRIIATTRHGKYLLAEFDYGSFLILHLGMTGEIVALGKGASAKSATEKALVITVCPENVLVTYPQASTVTSYLPDGAVTR